MNDKIRSVEEARENITAELLNTLFYLGIKTGYFKVKQRYDVMSEAGRRKAMKETIERTGDALKDMFADDSVDADDITAEKAAFHVACIYGARPETWVPNRIMSNTYEYDVYEGAFDCQRCNSKRIFDISAKCSDMFHGYLEQTKQEINGFVPEGYEIGGSEELGNPGYGDFVIFRYCLDCGQIQGNFPVSIEKEK